MSPTSVPGANAAAASSTDVGLMEKAISDSASRAGLLAKARVPAGREEECSSLGEANRARAAALLLPAASAPAPPLSPSHGTVDELAA
jgi:hypothetical protein